MTRELNHLAGTAEYDNLFAGIEPAALVRGGVIAKGASQVTYKRGTLLGKANGKLSLYAGTGTPDCVLTDDVTVGTAADENVTVYITGYFNKAKLIVGEGYTLTEADADELRKKGILLGTVQAL